MNRPTVRPRVEEMEPRLVPSATPLMRPELAGGLVAQARAHPAPFLAGSLHGTYTLTPTPIVDAGARYALSGSGTLTGVGSVHVVGALDATGMIATGHARGTLTLRNAAGTLLLELQGPAQRGFAPLPHRFHFAVQEATGVYAGLLGTTGTVRLRLLPGLAPGAFTGGAFSLTILPASSPGSTRTGIEGVAMVGPIFPVDRPGVPNSRPLPGALITVQPAGGGQEIARVRADDLGQFQLRLAPGTYLLVPLPPQPGQFLPHGIPETVTVPPDGFAQVVVNYDSGIR